MEYQSFFMLLKKYSILDDKFCSISPLSAEGYVRIKKEQDRYKIIIQINNYDKPSKVYIVSDSIIKQSKIEAATTKIELFDDINVEKTCILLPDIGLFAVKSSTDICEQALQKIKNAINKDGNILDKVFGKVYDTYFFDCIKPKLAGLFSLGTNVPELCKIYPQSKWTMVKAGNQCKLIGVVYKNNFAYAIGVGDQQNSALFETICQQNEISSNFSGSFDRLNANQVESQSIFCGKFNDNLVTVDGKNYSLLFLSAKNGKFIQI